MAGGPLDDLIAELDEVPAVIIRAAADRFAELAYAEARRTPWHRWGRMGTRPERLVISNDQASLRIVGSPAAVWAWAEAGIDSHVIRRRAAPARGRRGGGRRSSSTPGRGRARAVLALETGPVMGPVRHPGYRRLGAWSRAADRLDTEAADIAGRALDRL